MQNESICIQKSSYQTPCSFYYFISISQKISLSCPGLIDHLLGDVFTFSKCFSLISWLAGHVKD